jgi:tryptophan-rich sensory protein
MNTVKKYLGIVWILLAAAMAFFSIEIFGGKLSSGKQDDLVFGIIIFFILLYFAYLWKRKNSQP